MRSEDQYIDLFKTSRQLLDEPCHEVMNSQRQRSFENFLSSGFASRKVERYKYTDLQAAFAPDYGLNLKRLDIPVNPYDAFRCDVPNLSTSLYFMINDQFNSKNLPTGTLPEGVVVTSLLEACRTMPEKVEPYYCGLSRFFPSQHATLKDQAARGEEDCVTALNTMLCQDGLFIYIPRNVRLERTIQVVNILSSKVDLMVNRRVLVVMEENTEAKLLFCDHSQDESSFLATEVIEVYAGVNSNLEIYSLEETHQKSHRFSNVYISQDSGSNVTYSSLTLHNGETRNMVYSALKGQGAEMRLYGGVIADKRQRVDNYTLIDHIAPSCTSDELFKYVLDDESTGAFAGRVLVRKGADGTSSQETNQNLCASAASHMYTQPMLEIYADDVKCNHGSTVGQLSESALFYMRQRGIEESEARMLLKFAFMSQVLDKISIPGLADRLRYLVDKRFRGELSKCEGCRLCH